VLTARGAGCAGLVIVLYVGGVLLGYEELLVPATATLVALFLGLGWVLRRPSLTVRREVEPDRVTRGTPAFGVLDLRNAGRVASAPALAVEPCGDERVIVDVPRLPVGSTVTRRYRLPTERRCVLDVGPVEIVVQDPLGLWRTDQRAGDARRVWVHPVVHPMLGLPAGRTRSMEGESADRVPHGNQTFHALREYVIGDDLRLVHWRSFARTGTLMVREHVDTSVPEVTVLVDDRARAHSADSFEEAMECAASIVVAATSAGHPVRMVATSGRAVSVRGGAGQARGLLDCLAELYLGDGELRPVIARLSLERGSDTLVVVTGDAASEDLRVIGSLARRYDDAILVSVGAEPLRVGGMSTLSGSTAGEVVSRWNRAFGR
jgi:uncharacterized protein (DUF58 family)